MTTEILTQDRLKELLDYNPETGKFRWIKCKRKDLIGKIAGGSVGIGYIGIMIDYKHYRSHRLAWFYMTGFWPKDQIDHINHIRDDNRFVNLREATQIDNLKNLRMRDSNISGVMGVSWDKRRNKWRASIKVNGKSMTIGRFEDFNNAVSARKSAEYKHGFHVNHGG